MIFDHTFIKPSFFDTSSINSQKNSTNSFKLWLTEEDFFKKYQTEFHSIDKGKCLYQGMMCKQDTDTEINDYLFKLYDKYLVQESLNDKEKIIVVKIDDQDNINESDGEMPFFMLSRDQSFDILVPETIQEYLQWIKLLNSRCIRTEFGKNYKYQRIIGKGSFAKVMLCRRISDGKKFAVKTYDKQKIKKSKNSKMATEGVKNEIKLMQQINHKNIIHLHEVFEGDYHIYLVLDLLTGGELFEKLYQIDNYSEKNACLFLKNLLEALDYLHSQGIMHRDIKPENLILRDKESETEVVLVDFGLGEKQNSEANLIFKRCGTPGYAAPEILNNKPYDTQADIFSAGIILYIILTGYSPFFGDSYEEILAKNEQCQICFQFEKIGIRLSTEAMALLKSMLKINPKERPTAQEALLHPWFQKYLTSNSTNHLKLPLIQRNQFIQNQKEILQQTKPKQEKFSNSNDLIMNSPIILGNIEEIKSPFNIDSPHILITPSPNKQNSRQKQLFSNIFQETRERIIDNCKQYSVKNGNNNNSTVIKANV